MTKKNTLFEVTFHKILFVHYVRYSAQIISQSLGISIPIHYNIIWNDNNTVTLEHKSSNNGESTNGPTCKTNMAW